MDRRLSGKPQDRLEGLGDFAKRASGLFVPTETDRLPDQDKPEKPKRIPHTIKINTGPRHTLSVEARKKRRIENRKHAVVHSTVRRRNKHGRQVKVAQ